MKLQRNEHGPPERAGHARWGVLGRPDSAAIEAPCVLPSHAPIAPRQRVVTPLELLELTFTRARGDNAVVGADDWINDPGARHAGPKEHQACCTRLFPWL